MLKFIYKRMCPAPHYTQMHHDTTGVLIVGIFAGALSIVAFTPHAWAIYNSGKRATKNADLWTYCVYALSLLLWGIYGSLRDDTPLAATCFLQFAVVFCISMYVVCIKPTPHGSELVQDSPENEMQNQASYELEELGQNDAALL